MFINQLNGKITGVCRLDASKEDIMKVCSQYMITVNSKFEKITFEEIIEELLK